jgi:hypothetical protein
VKYLRYLRQFGRDALAHPRCLLLGYREGNGYTGVTYDNDPESPRSVAYDVGRTLRRRDLEI